MIGLRGMTVSSLCDRTNPVHTVGRIEYPLVERMTGLLDKAVN